MKILATGDLHLGKIVNGYQMLSHQEFVLKQIIDVLISETVDLLVLTGDIYDRALAPKEAIKVFDEFISQVVKVGVKVAYISGNHDSYERVSFLSGILKSQNIFIGKEFLDRVDYFSIIENGQTYNFYLIPYMPYQYIREITNNQEIMSFNDSYKYMLDTINLNEADINICVTHAFIGGVSSKPETSDSEKLLAVGGLDYVTSTLFEPFDYTLLGHIHKPQKVGSEHIRYTGSIYKYSFSEVNNQKSLLLLDIKSKENIKQTLIDIKFDRDYVVIKGFYEDIINNKDLLIKHKNDYVKILLEDETDLPDGISKLKSYFEYLMEFSYIKDANLSNQNSSMSDALASKMLTKKNDPKTIVEIFSDFTKQSANYELEKEDLNYVEDLINEILKGGEYEN